MCEYSASGGTDACLHVVESGENGNVLKFIRIWQVRDHVIIAVWRRELVLPKTIIIRVRSTDIRFSCRVYSFLFTFYISDSFLEPARLDLRAMTPSGPFTEH